MVSARSLATALLLLAAQVSGHALVKAGHTGHSVAARSKTFMRSFGIKQVLRICNAYAYAAPLDVFVARHQITTEPLEYRACGEYTPFLKVGDQVDFRVHNTTAGTFTINDLPNGNAKLLMVIYRHDATSTAVAFDSHVFADSPNPQVAVLDTYKGSARSDLLIQDTPSGGDSGPARSEVLRYDNVVAIEPGVYDLSLRAVSSGQTQARSQLVAVPGEAYIVVRCGLQGYADYPEELIVFPHSDRAALGGTAASRPCALLLTLLAAASLLGLPGRPS